MHEMRAVRSSRQKGPNAQISGRELLKLAPLVLRAATEGLPKIDFFLKTLKLLITCTNCDLIFARVEGGRSLPCAMAVSRQSDSLCLVLKDAGAALQCGSFPGHGRESDLFGVLRATVSGGRNLVHGNMTADGTFWTNDAGRLYMNCPETIRKEIFEEAWMMPGHKSLALVPLDAGDAGAGYLQFVFESRDDFSRNEIEVLEDTTRLVGAALVQWHATWSLRERVKELSCMYGIANVLDSPSKSLEDILGEIVEIVPSAWLHEDVAAARITFDGNACATSHFLEGAQSQSAPIVVKGERRGLIEVVYTEFQPKLDEGPFLQEERKLLDTIARAVSVRIERRLYEQEQQKIKEQMKQSNRLSMVGQFAAAVAHDINEPLTNILGFAELAAKCPGLPKQAAEDLEKIVGTSLHAREIVRKLLTYGRKMPQKESSVNVNKIVREVLGFFDYRFGKEGIRVELALSEEAGELRADPGQLRQVVSNLLLNAIQAMPNGGVLTVKSSRSEGEIVLIVEDSGCGMTPEIQDKIFIPFFTTKSAHQGTGLGLTVVLEIVTSMRGTIHVESAPGSGTAVEVRLPPVPAPAVPNRGRGRK